MAVITPVREAGPAAPPPARHQGRRPLRALGLAAVVLLSVLGLDRITGLLPDFSSPFGVDRIDRTGPAVLHAITDMSEYKAATAHLQVIVDVEEDARWLPDVLRGERVLFVARGSVDAGVDFRGLKSEAVEVSDGGKSARIQLPHAELSKPVVDPEGSYVHSRQRGLLDRIGSMFADNPTGERELYLLARTRLAAAAAEDKALVRRAETNTRIMLERLLEGLGFETVVIEFH